MNRNKFRTTLAMAFSAGLALLTATAGAAVLHVPAAGEKADGFRKDVMPVIPKGYSLTKGLKIMSIQKSAIENAGNSPLTDPFAPLVSGFDNAFFPSSGDVYTSGSYYGPGPVMLGVKHIYIIWYGNWSGNTATTIIPRFIQALNRSPYENIETTYTSQSGLHMSNAITLSGQTNDYYSQGTLINDANVQAIVRNALQSHRLPQDTGGIYLVLTSADVNETSGFCTQYCGWHTDGLNFGASDIKYAFVGDPDQCAQIAGTSYNPCIVQANSPNGNAGADAMVSVIAHETEEAATDPQPSNGPYGWIGYDWYDGNSYENGDQCAYRFGAATGELFVTMNGSYANMSLGGHDYLIQKNVVITDPSGRSDYGVNYANWLAWSQNGSSIPFGYGVPTPYGTSQYCGLHYP